MNLPIGSPSMNTESDLYCIVYQSEATVFMSTQKLESIIEQAIPRNKELNITGVLLSDGHLFIQYLEGPKKSLQLVYELILQSASHTKIKVLVDQPIKKREFPKWFMGLMRPSQSELLDILNWEWWDNINDRPWNNRNNVGIQKLHEFCNQLGTEPAGSYEL